LLRRRTPQQRNVLGLAACAKPFIVPIPAPGDIREIDSAFSKIEVHGGRMNEEQSKVVDQTA
jgi:hypothetical protein